MKKITLLAASALLLLTACGQVESGPPEIAPATVVQGDVQQPQSTPDPTMTVQEPDTASGVVQEQPQEKKAQQTEAAPPAAVTLSRSKNLRRTFPPRQSMPRRAMWNLSLHQSRNSRRTCSSRRPAGGHRRGQRLRSVAVRCSYGQKPDAGQQRLPFPRRSAGRCFAGDVGGQGTGHGGLYLPPAHDADGPGQCGRRRISL